MPTLLLKLAGPLQSWGDSSRFNHRHTREAPTKSGILGLLAAADGRRRSDSIEDLLSLKFGVRTEQPGTVLRDFQTEIDWRTGKSHALTYRYYLADAIFVAAVDGPGPLIEGLHEALRHPRFPLYLGRRSCPPAERPLIGIREGSFVEALREEQWYAEASYRRKQPTRIRLPITRDCLPAETPHESVRDVPVSFDVRHREYGWREVVREYGPPITNKAGRAPAHDPMALVEE